MGGNQGVGKPDTKELIIAFFLFIGLFLVAVSVCFIPSLAETETLSSVFYEEKDGYTIYYNITVSEYEEYVKNHNNEPPMKPILILKHRIASTDEIVYANKTNEKVREYLIARENTINLANTLHITGWILMITGFIALTIIGIKEGKNND